MLRLPSRADTITLKGDDPDRDAYSGFEGTALATRLRRARVKRVFVGGLATDYCVKATALDGLKGGFTVFVLTDATRGVDVHPGDSEQALQELEANGARLLTYAQLRKNAGASRG